MGNALRIQAEEPLPGGRSLCVVGELDILTAPALAEAISSQLAIGPRSTNRPRTNGTATGGGAGIEVHNVAEPRCHQPSGARRSSQLTPTIGPVSR